MTDALLSLFFFAGEIETDFVIPALNDDIPETVRMSPRKKTWVTPDILEPVRTRLRRESNLSSEAKTYITRSARGSGRR